MARRIIRHSIAALGLAALACNLVLDYNALDEGCPTGTKFCDGQCVEFDTPDFGCASEACDRCVIPNAASGARLECTEQGDCSPTRCATGYKECDNACVATDDPTRGCAGAGCEPCPGADTGAAICTDPDRQCGLSTCPSSQKLCGATCESRTDPEFGCGAVGCDPCSIDNALSYECEGGACLVTNCTSGYKACDNECVSVRDPDFGCAAPGSCSPCFGTNVSGTGWTCSTQGVCKIASCSATHFRDCDQLPNTGCEVDIRTNINNCGTCGTICGARDGTATVGCASSNCTVLTCVSGRYDCDRVYSNGCERTAPCGT